MLIIEVNSSTVKPLTNYTKLSLVRTPGDRRNLIALPDFLLISVLNIYKALKAKETVFVLNGTSINRLRINESLL